MANLKHAGGFTSATWPANIREAISCFDKLIDHAHDRLLVLEGSGSRLVEEAIIRLIILLTEQIRKLWILFDQLGPAFLSGLTKVDRVVPKEDTGPLREVLALNLSKLCSPSDLLKGVPVSFLHLLVRKRRLCSDNRLQPGLRKV